MIITTTPTIEGRQITEYHGVVFGEVIAGINFVKDFFAGIRNIVGGRSGSYEEELTKARNAAMAEMENRAARMGANAVVCDPHRVVISGPARLHGVEMSSPDIRAGMAMVVAAACAKGNSTIHNAEMIYRGYSHLLPKLNALGVAAREIEA